MHEDKFKLSLLLLGIIIIISLQFINLFPYDFLNNFKESPDWDNWLCIHRSLEIYSQAKEHGLKMYMVVVVSNGTGFGHSINAVKGKNGEWIFIENNLATSNCLGETCGVGWNYDGAEIIRIYDNITIGTNQESYRGDLVESFEFPYEVN